MADNWWSNPGFKKFASEALQDFGYGLSNSTNIGNAFGAATNRMQQMEPYRAEMAQQEETAAKLAEQTNVTRSWLEQQGFTDLVPLVDAGQADIAYGEALKRMQPGYGQTEAPKPIEVNGQLVDPTTGRVIGDYRDPNSGQPAAPSGYQWTQEGTQTYIPGGPADPTNQSGKPPTEAELRAAGLTTVIEPDARLLLGDGTPQNPGIFEALGSGGDQFLSAGIGGIAPLSPFASTEYRQAKDAVTSIAQSYLYSTSGASAPDAEVQRVADSVTPKPFDTPAQIADKKARLEVMVNSVRQKQGNAAPAADGWQDMGNGVRIRPMGQ